MKNYEIDKETGFLTTIVNNQVNGFTAKQKTIFLSAFEETGNMTKSAKLAGVTRSLVADHIEQDSAFYMAYKQIVEAHCDFAEENLIKMMRRNTVACFGFLRAYRNHVWGDKKTTDTKSKTEEKLKKLLDQANGD